MKRRSIDDEDNKDTDEGENKDIMDCAFYSCIQKL